MKRYIYVVQFWSDGKIIAAFTAKHEAVRFCKANWSGKLTIDRMESTTELNDKETCEVIYTIKKVELI